MTTRFLPICIGCLVLAGHLPAAEEESTQKTNIKELLRARMAEDAQKKGTTPAPKPAATAPVPTLPSSTPPPPAPTSPAAAEKAVVPSPEAIAAAKEVPPTKIGQEPVTMMPKVEVKRERITVLDHELAKQEKDIARERKNLKPSEVDLALNDTKIAKPLALFGGESAQFRKRVASERVELMEFEKDLTQAIAQAKTKDEKQELQKQLDEIRAVRRDLEKSLR